jgi:hypothetical protein
MIIMLAIALGAGLVITGVGMLVGKIGEHLAGEEHPILQLLGIVLIGLGVGIGAIAITAVLQAVPDPGPPPYCPWAGRC